MSVRRSVGRSVGPSVRRSVRYIYFRSRILLFQGLQRIITAPAQPHATKIAVYTALLSLTSCDEFYYERMFLNATHYLSPLLYQISINVFVSNHLRLSVFTYILTYVYLHVRKSVCPSICCKSYARFILTFQKIVISLCQRMLVL